MKKIICITIAVSMLTTGCSVFVPKTQAVSASCSEADATLQINGGQTFQGHAQVESRRDRGISIVCYKPGYYPAQKSISPSISWTGVADFVGSIIFIIPIVGIFSPGAWDLDETDVTVNMVQY